MSEVSGILPRRRQSFCCAKDVLSLLQGAQYDEVDREYWQTQWGNTAHFSHGTNGNGRWIIMIIKQDSATLIFL